MFRLIAITLLLIDLGASISRAALVILDWPKSNGQNFLDKPINDPAALDAPVYQEFALSDDGSLCTIDRSAGDALIYPKVGSAASLDGVIRQHLGDDPTAVVFKRVGKDKSYFAIAGADREIWVIDAGTGLIKRKIETKAAAINCMAAAVNPDVGLVYYSGGYQARVGRINLISLIDEGMITLPVGAPSNALQIAASPDGSLLYAAQAHVQPPAYWVYKVGDTVPLEAKQSALGNAEDMLPFVPSPDGNFVAAGKQLFPPDLSGTSAMATPGRVLAFSAKRPLMFGVGDDGQIQVLSTNTDTTIATTQPLFPYALRPGRRLVRLRASASAAMFFDDLHGKLIEANWQHVAVISLDDMHVPSEPIVNVTVKADSSVVAGRTWFGMIKRADPSITLQLVDEPAGMKLVSDRLNWTPTNADVGPHTFHLSFSEDNLHRDITIQLTVTRGGLRLPFEPDVMALAPDGHTAVIARRQVRQQSNTALQPGEEQSIGSEVAIVDLVKEMVVCQRSLLTPLELVTIDGHFVYIAKPHASAFTALSLLDLTDVKRVFTDDVIISLTTTGNRIYVGQSGKPFTWLSLPDLAPDDGSPLTPGAMPILHGSPPRHVGQGWYDNGVIFDPKFEHAIRIVQDDSFHMIGTSRMNDPFPWGQPPSIGELRAQNQSPDSRRGPRRPGAPPPAVNRGQSESPINRGESNVVLPDRPLIAELAQYQSNTVSSRGIGRTIIRTQINLFTLARGEELEPLILVDGPRPDDFTGSPDTLRLAVNSDSLIALVGDQVFIVPLASLEHGALAVPLSLSPPEGTILLPGDRASFVKMQIDGGKLPFHFELSEDLPGVEIDPNTGILKIIPRPLLDDAAASFAGSQQNYPPGFPHRPLRFSHETIDQYQAAAAQRVSEMTGKIPTGIPIELMLTVIARDANQQTVRTVVGFIIDMPAAPLRAKLAMPPPPAPVHPPAIPPANQPVQPPNTVPA